MTHIGQATPASSRQHRVQLHGSGAVHRGRSEHRAVHHPERGERQGYLAWLWWRDGRPWPFGLLGEGILFLYGIIPTYQPAHFGRVYAAYGGVFVVLSVLWGSAVDRIAPDGYDVVGALICLIDVAVIMYAPRAGFLAYYPSPRRGRA
jgi:small multidrug resistance family-3 protein